MIGALRSRLVFERKAQVADGAGGFDETWEAAFAVWGSLEATGGREGVAADQVGAETNYRLRIRFRNDVSTDLRVRTGEKILAIDWSGDPDGRRYWLDLGCVEGRPS